MRDVSHPPRRQRVAAYGRVVRDGSVLLTRISVNGHHTGHWTLPGGGVDHGERPHHAVAREIFEETGLRARVGRILGVHDTHFTGVAPDGRTEDYHGIHLVFHATVGSDEPYVSETDGTTDDVAWIGLDRLDDQPVLDLVRFAAFL